LIARDFGGTRNGTVIRWPNGIKDRGGLRTQFAHVIDIAPTILEAAGLPQPRSVNGTVQTPIEGVSMVYTFDNAKAPERHKPQYFEMFGNRAIYQDGWLRPDHSPCAVANECAEAAVIRCLGPVRREKRFQPQRQRRRRTACEAEADAGAVHEGSREVSRATH